MLVSVQADWDDVYSDMVKVWGEPTSKHSDRLQNGYGATFDQMQVSWVTSDSTAIAVQSVGQYPMHIVEVMSSAYLHAKTVEKENNHKSTIE